MSEPHEAGVEVIRFADATPTPWLAGGGVTRELLRNPAADHFDWRISVADVSTSGPFSTLPGIDRVLTFCDGPSMAITVAGRRRDLARWEPVAFSGDDPTSGHVTDATRDLNVMTRRGACAAAVEVIEIDERTLTNSGAREIVVVVLDGALSVHQNGIEEVTDLTQFDAVRLAGDAPVTLTGPGRAQIVTFR